MSEGEKYHYIPGQLFNVTLSDSTEAVFTDQYGISGYCTGFHTSGADGTMTVVGADAASDTVTLYVLKGTYYPYGVRYFKSTGTAPTITVAAVR